MQDLISHDRLLHRLNFNPSTATFTWLACADVGEKFNETMPGRTAGSMTHDGHFVVTVDGRAYPAHELAWFYMSGSWPKRRGMKRKRRLADNGAQA